MKHCIALIFSMAAPYLLDINFANLKRKHCFEKKVISLQSMHQIFVMLLRDVLLLNLALLKKNIIFSTFLVCGRPRKVYNNEHETVV